jgi:hypothetical protein
MAEMIHDKELNYLNTWLDVLIVEERKNVVGGICGKDGKIVNMKGIGC